MGGDEWGAGGWNGDDEWETDDELGKVKRHEVAAHQKEALKRTILSCGKSQSAV